MKKLIALILVLCLSLAAAAAIAEEDGEEYVFYTDANPEAKVYYSTWVAEDGDWRVEVYDEDGGLKLMVVHQMGDNKWDVWEYAGALGENNELVCLPFGLHYKQDIVTGAWDEVYYEDGDAVFTVNTDGKLLWEDVKEDAGKGLEFQKIGNFYGGRWMKGDIEVIFYEWYDGQYDIRLYQLGEGDEILKDAILKGDYDAATDTLTARGEFEGEDPIEIVFSYNEHNYVVWTENGESTVLEFSYRID